MIAAAVLVLVTILYRVVLGIAGSSQLDGWHNFSPMAAIALCGAIYFPRKVAIAFPLLALLISDLILNAHYVAPMLSFDLLPRYLAFGLVAGFAWMQRGNPQPVRVLGSSLLASVVFFLITNTGSWLAEPRYAGGFAGWLQALTVGLPGYPTTLTFFRQTLISDLLFTGLFLICMAMPRVKSSAPALSGIEADPSPSSSVSAPERLTI